MKPVYLYVFEHETDFMSLDEPTKHDIVCFENGLLVIYKITGTKVETLCMNGPTGAPCEWIKVEKGNLIPPPPELEELGPYHGLGK
jgi:hypothetical protein